MLKWLNKMNKTSDPFTRNLQYYEKIDKVFWVPYEDIILENKNVVKGNTSCPCIFVHVDEKTKQMKILQFDMSIEFDEYRYTAWRKVIGITYGIRVDVLLINDSKLFTLEGKEIDFGSLGRSDVWVDKKYLGKCDIK
jgi:hypothetical protein